MYKFPSIFALPLLLLAGLSGCSGGGGNSPAASTTPSTTQLAPVSPGPMADSIKTINHEQDSQADRCKNGYSDGCDKERALAEFKKATGQ